MSTTVKYKGNTLATVSNNTKTLKTAGKYMEGDVVLTDVSTSANVWQDAQGYVHLDDEGTAPITVEPLSVTQNGTYTAPTGKAYSPVTVNVSGGATNVVVGEFTASTAGTVQEISVNYSGDGLPISILIFPKDGYISGNTLYDIDHQYAIVHVSAFRSEANSAYFAGYGACMYKNNATGSVVSTTRINAVRMFGVQTDPTSSATTSVMIRNQGGFAVFVSDTSYGFLSGQTYNYVITYSS